MKRAMLLSILLCTIFSVLIACSDQSQTAQPLTSITHSSDAPTAILGTATPTATSTPGIATPTASSVPTATQTTTPTSSISTTITIFYQTIENKTYTRAYSYLSSDATTTSGQKITKDVFLQMAQLGDADGAVTSFDFIADSTDATQIIVTLMRSSSLRYHAHLRMKEKGNVWKITQIDRI